MVSRLVVVAREVQKVNPIFRKEIPFVVGV